MRRTRNLENDNNSPTLSRFSSTRYAGNVRFTPMQAISMHALQPTYMLLPCRKKGVGYATAVSPEGIRVLDSYPYACPAATPRFTLSFHAVSFPPLYASSVFLLSDLSLFPSFRSDFFVRFCITISLSDSGPSSLFLRPEDCLSLFYISVLALLFFYIYFSIQFKKKI